MRRIRSGHAWDRRSQKRCYEDWPDFHGTLIKDDDTVWGATVHFASDHGPSDCLALPAFNRSKAQSNKYCKTSTRLTFFLQGWPLIRSWLDLIYDYFLMYIIIRIHMILAAITAGQ